MSNVLQDFQNECIVPKLFPAEQLHKWGSYWVQRCANFKCEFKNYMIFPVLFDRVDIWNCRIHLKLWTTECENWKKKFEMLIFMRTYKMLKLGFYVQYWLLTFFPFNLQLWTCRNTLYYILDVMWFFWQHWIDRKGVWRRVCYMYFFLQVQILTII